MSAVDKVDAAVVTGWAREILAEWLSGHQAIDGMDDERYRIACVGTHGDGDTYRVSVDGYQDFRRFRVIVTAVLDGEP